MKLTDYFEFRNKTKIIYGPKSLGRIGEEANKLGIKKPFIVADPAMTATGFTALIEKKLKKSGLECAGTFSDIPQDSDIEIVLKGYNFMREIGADSIIAIGGGSTLDTAKGIGIVASTEGKLPEGINILNRPLPPFIAVPSTAGTGSEITFAAVIKDKKRKLKISFQSFYLASDVAILDPTITLSMPPRLTASTGMDALTHAVEALHSTFSEPVCDALAIHAIRLIGGNIREATKNGGNLEARGNMLLASTIAGLAFTNSLVGCVHAMAHACGGSFNVPHGIANAILLPYGMEYNLGFCADRYAEVARALKLNVEGLTYAEAALRAVAYIRKLTKELELPQSLDEVGITEKDVPKIAEDAMLDATMFTNPRRPKQSEIEAVLAKAQRGEEPAKELVLEKVMGE
jgi:alcohol dehydrogenase class IV